MEWRQAAARQALLVPPRTPAQGPRLMLWGLVQDRASLYCFTAVLGTESWAKPATDDWLEPWRSHATLPTLKKRFLSVRPRDVFLVSLGPFRGTVTGWGSWNAGHPGVLGMKGVCFVSFTAGVFPDCGLLPLSWSPEGSASTLFGGGGWEWDCRPSFCPWGREGGTLWSPLFKEGKQDRR